MQNKIDNYDFHLADISDQEILYYPAINKQILDTVISSYATEKKIQQENQEIYSLKIPKARHKVFDFFLTKILRIKQKLWQPWEVIATNHKYQLLNGILNILVKKNVNKDTYIIFHTTAKTIIQLQNLGLTKSQALTSQVIESAGLYNLLVESRRIESKIVTHKTQLKTYIVADLQHHVRLLQPIERLICAYHNKPDEEYKKSVVDAFNSYKKQLFAESIAINNLLRVYKNKGVFSTGEKSYIENTLHMSIDLLQEFLSHDKDYLLERLKYINNAIKSCNNFDSDFLNIPSQSKTISDQLQTFLRNNLDAIVSNAQALNDQVTHNAKNVLFRGKLRDCLMDTDKIISNYVFDQLHPITYEHQSNYCTNEQGDSTATNDKTYGLNKIIYHSNVHGGHGKKDLEKILMGITALEDKSKKCSDDNIKEVKSAAWNNFSTYSKKQKFRRFAAWVLTTIAHIPLSPINLLIAALTGQAPIANFMLKIENFITRKLGIKEHYTHHFFKLREKLGVNNVYTSTAIGKMVNKVVREVTAVIFQAPKLIAKSFIAQLKLFRKDFESGLWGLIHKKYQKENDQDTVVSHGGASEAAQALEKEAIDRLIKLFEDAKTLNRVTDVSVNEIPYAVPSQHLDPYRPHDILSSVMNGLEGFFNFFKNDVFEKNPTTAFIASIAYAFGAGTILTPVMLTTILAKAGLSATQINLILNTCTKIGKATAKGQFNEAIASGFTIAKLTGVTINTLNQGFDSVLCEIINEIRKDPLVYAAGLGLAYGFGHLLTDVINIPGVTSKLRDEIGTVPALAKIIIGAKVGLISLESALPEDKEEKSILAHFINDLANLILILLRAAASVITLSPNPWIDLSAQLFRGSVIVGHFINRLLVLAGQMLTQLPKTLFEVGSTLIVNSLKIVNLVTLPFRSQKQNSVIGVGPILHAKNVAFQSGYQFTFTIREDLSRKPERWYGKAMKEMEPTHKNQAQSSHAVIMTNLMSYGEKKEHNNDELLTPSPEIVDTQQNTRVSNNTVRQKKPSPIDVEDKDYLPKNYLRTSM